MRVVLNSSSREVPPSIAIEALVLGGLEVVRVVLNSSSREVMLGGPESVRVVCFTAAAAHTQKSWQLVRQTTGGGQAEFPFAKHPPHTISYAFDFQTLCPPHPIVVARRRSSHKSLHAMPPTSKLFAPTANCVRARLSGELSAPPPNPPPSCLLPPSCLRPWQTASWPVSLPKRRPPARALNRGRSTRAGAVCWRASASSFWSIAPIRAVSSVSSRASAHAVCQRMRRQLTCGGKCA